MPSQRTRHGYPPAGPEDPVTWSDLRSILDTHGLRLTPHGKGQRGPEAKVVRREFKAWVDRQRIHPGLPYTMPLRDLVEHVSRFRRDLISCPTGGTSWALVVNALNDPNSGLEIVRLRFARAA